MKPNLRMRLCSLGEGGCPVGVLLVEARVDSETGSAEREMRRRSETLLDPSKD